MVPGVLPSCPNARPGCRNGDTKPPHVGTARSRQRPKTLWSQKSKMLEKTRGEKSLRLVSSIHENLEYDINSFKKHEIEVWNWISRTLKNGVDFHLQLKESLPRTDPPPTPPYPLPLGFILTPPTPSFSRLALILTPPHHIPFRFPPLPQPPTPWFLTCVSTDGWGVFVVFLARF